MYDVRFTPSVDRPAMVCRLVDAVARWQSATTPGADQWTEAS